MIWVLDTNVLIQAARGYPPVVARRYHAAMADPRGQPVVSAISIAELWHGAAKHADPSARRVRWNRFLKPLTVVPFDRRAAELAGDLKHALRHAPIGGSDLFIAATALANGCGVVTANVREFSRVPGLAVEDWTA